MIYTPTASQLRLAKAMSEDELNRNCIDLCAQLRLLVNHNRPALNQRGQWSTAMRGDPGVPDLNPVAGPGGILYRELKNQTNKLEPAQERWRDMLLAAGADWDLWRPIDWLTERIHRELRAIARRPRPPAVGTAPLPLQTLPPILGYLPSPTLHS
jgi:hypothetical protein